MIGIVHCDSPRVAVLTAPAMSSSQGALATQGTGVSPVTVTMRQAFDSKGLSFVARSRTTQPIDTQDKLVLGRHSAFVVTSAAEAGKEPADLWRVARLRNARTATVSRSRHRSRLG